MNWLVRIICQKIIYQKLYGIQICIKILLLLIISFKTIVILRLGLLTVSLYEYVKGNPIGKHQSEAEVAVCEAADRDEIGSPAANVFKREPEDGDMTSSGSLRNQWLTQLVWNWTIRTLSGWCHNSQLFTSVLGAAGAFTFLSCKNTLQPVNLSPCSFLVTPQLTGSKSVSCWRRFSPYFCYFLQATFFQRL